MKTKKEQDNFNHHNSGSSLIGVALLTLVMGFLMSGGVQLMKTYDGVETKIETDDNILKLQDAIKNFVGIHKRYPCPAQIDIPPDQSGFGQEDCSIADVSGRDGLGVKIGTVPVRTLNIPDDKIVDGYGRRFIYAVTTDRTASDGTADPRNGQGAITILHSLDGFEQPVSTPEGYIIYAIMSSGQDGRGAFDINGNQVLPCDSTSLAGENCDFTDAIFKTTETVTAGKSTDFSHKFAFVARGPEHYWYTSPWSDCGKQLNGIKWSGQTRGGVTASRPVCFSSYQERQVVCRDKQGNDVADTMCQHTDMPLEIRSCSIGPCRWVRQRVACETQSISSPSCAAAPSCEVGMQSVVTGKDDNSCNTYLCVSENCAPKPDCNEGDISYSKLDSNNCPEWQCTLTTNPNCPADQPPTDCGAIGFRSIEWQGCTYHKCNTCVEGPRTCSAGKTRVYLRKDAQSGCDVFGCKTCPTSTPPTNCGAIGYREYTVQGCTRYTCNSCSEGAQVCPTGQRKTYVSKNEITGCRIYECQSCPKISPPTNCGSAGYTSYTTTGCKRYKCRSSSSSSNTGSTSQPTVTKSCPTKPTCSAGKTLKNNGKNSLGCVSWTCVAKSCPKKPTCPSGKKLEKTGEDSNGCSTYRCI